MSFSRSAVTFLCVFNRFHCGLIIIFLLSVLNRTPESWRVQLGKFRRGAWAHYGSDYDNVADKPVMMTLDALIIHPDYDDDTNDNDIAILILSSKVKFTDKINAVKLNSDKTKAFDSSSECYITGWGTLTRKYVSWEFKHKIARRVTKPYYCDSFKLQCLFTT